MHAGMVLGAAAVALAAIPTATRVSIGLAVLSLIISLIALGRAEVTATRVKRSTEQGAPGDDGG